MNDKRSIAYLECHKFISKQKYFLLIMFILLLVMAQTGFMEYKAIKKEVERSVDLEQLRSSQLKRYAAYGVYGVRFNAMPSPLYFLLNFKICGCLEALVNSGTGLKIYESKKEPGILSNTAGGYLGFSGIFLLLISFLALYNGYDASKNIKYLRFLCSLKPFNRVIFGIFLLKILLISGYILVLLAGTVILAFINGIHIAGGTYFQFSLLALLAAMVYLFLGSSLTVIFNGRFSPKIVLAVVFIILKVVYPLLISIMTGGFAGGPSENKTEYEQHKILSAFENRGVEKFGDLRSGEDVKKFMKGYKENELEIIEGIERKYKDDIIDKIDKYRAWSIILPSTFYLSSANEISGQGFNNYIDFYGFSEKKKREFFDFYVKKKYFPGTGTGADAGHVESFIKGDENIFYSGSSLPANFYMGMVLMLVYITGLGLITYRKAYKKVFPLKQKLEGEDNLYVVIKRGEPNILFTRDQLLKSKIYNHFSGKEKIKGEIDVVEALKEQEGGVDFLYLVDARYFDGIKPGTLHRFLLGERMRENMENREILFKYACRRRLIVMDGFLEGLPPDELNSIKMQVKEKKLSCLVITSDYYFAISAADDADNLYYFSNEPAAAVLKKELKRRFKNIRAASLAGADANTKEGMLDLLVLEKPENEVEN